MRVIAGDMRGRPIKAVPGKTTRPTTDKVKEAVFQILGPFFQGGICLDLFAGSGALGIEALSRGMDKGVFVDKNSKAIHIIEENLKGLHIRDRAEVFRADAARALHAAANRGLLFDLILFDPPYGKVNYDLFLQQIMNLNLLQKGGVIYCEHEIGETFSEKVENIGIIKQVNYGDTTGITIFKHEI